MTPEWFHYRRSGIFIVNLETEQVNAGWGNLITFPYTALVSSDT